MPFLDRLTRLNPTAVFLGTLALVLAGIFLPGALGGLVLLALVAVLVAITVRTWPVQPVRIRILRVLVLALFLWIAYLKF